MSTTRRSPAALPEPVAGAAGEWPDRVGVAPVDGDDNTGWLVTFSDLVLQLFAFVVVASVCGGAAQRLASRADLVSPPLQAVPVPAGAEAGPTHVTRYDGAAAREATADDALAAFEPAAVWAGDGASGIRAASGGPQRQVGERRPVDPTIAEDGGVRMDAGETGPAPRPARVEVDPALRVDDRAAVSGDRDGAPDAGPPDAAARVRSSRMRALGAYLAAFVSAGRAASDASVAQNGDDVRLAFGGRLGFRPGSAELLPAGRALLREVQRLASDVPSLQIEVAGYTDDVPIHTRAFPSNLELSLARAARVARELERDDPALAVRTVALGFGEHRALAPNDGPANRARNRRVEIRLASQDRRPTGRM